MHKSFYKINVLNVFDHTSKKCWEKLITFKYETKPPAEGFNEWVISHLFKRLIHQKIRQVNNLYE